MLNPPSGVSEAGQVIREKEDFSIEQVFDKYDNGDVELKKLLDGIFYEHGRIRPHERILCWFPKYLEFYSNTYDKVIGNSANDRGVLKLNQKLYLGIMAVSCYNCEYLLKILEEQFVLNGGDLEWITEGLKKVDPRLSKFAELNEIMAFRPWSISPSTIEKLMVNDEKGKGWNAEQLISCATVLAFFHGLCSFVQG